MAKVGCTSEKMLGGWTRRLATSVLLVGAVTSATWAIDLQIHAVEVPFVEALWKTSGHADKTALAFTDWDDAVPAVVPTGCARCHSSTGYQDYLGADGSAVGVVDKAPAVGTVIDCAACHNQATTTLSSVTFPSGVVVKDLGPEARCMVCHQGRQSKVSVDDALKTAGVSDPNKLDTAGPTSLTFRNMHYPTSTATPVIHRQNR